MRSCLASYSYRSASVRPTKVSRSRASSCFRIAQQVRHEFVRGLPLGAQWTKGRQLRCGKFSKGCTKRDRGSLTSSGKGHPSFPCRRAPDLSSSCSPKTRLSWVRAGDGILWLCFDGDLHFHTHFQTDVGTILGGGTVLDANLLI